MRQAAWHAAALVAARLGASALVRAGGLQALSDDDFARITIAQGFAARPALDPTGTSWLPVPFWVHGGAMMLLGRSVTTASVTAAVSGCIAILTLYAAARLAGVRPGAALLAGLACVFLPISALAGATTVPEPAVAALTASACLLLRARDPRWLLGAGVLLLAASLSRYEPWPVCLVAAAVALGPVLRPSASSASQKPVRLAAALLSVSGPLLWLGWNAYAHGDALRFHNRVASYRSALGGATHGLQALASGYPKAVLVDGAPLLLVAAAGLWLVRSRAAQVRGWAAPLAAAAVMLLSLVAAEATGGAPTHHPERALLAVWFVLWFVAADWLSHSVGSDGAKSVPPPGPEAASASLSHSVGSDGAKSVPPPGGSATSARLARAVGNHRRAFVACVAAAVLTFDLVRVVRLLPDYGTDRTAELEVGAWLREHAAPSDRVLIEPFDYGYFAVLAGSGRPEVFVVTRTLDPRDPQGPSPFASAEALRERAAQESAQWLVARGRPALREASPRYIELNDWQIARTRN